MEQNGGFPLLSADNQSLYLEDITGLKFVAVCRDDTISLLIWTRKLFHDRMLKIFLEKIPGSIFYGAGRICLNKPEWGSLSCLHIYGFNSPQVDRVEILESIRAAIEAKLIKVKNNSGIV